MPLPSSREMSIPPGERLRVVYLAGSGHTGSTLLALFLDAHPRIVSVGETAFKRSRQRKERTDLTCTCGASYVECSFWRRVFQGVNDAGFDFSPSEWSNDFRYKGRIAHRLFSRHARKPFWRLVHRAATAVFPGHFERMDRVRRVNVELVRTVLSVAGADVFFDTSKRAFRLHHLLQAEELDLKVVTLVRDVRGYASSAKRRGQSVADAARTWRIDQENFEDLTRDLPQDRRMLLRYEDVCGDPRTWLKRLHAFCGVEPIDPPEAVCSREHHVIGNNMRRTDTIRIRLDDKWQTLLNRDEQARALAIAGPLHARFGYAGRP
jgi:hypothetical protein